MKQGRQWISCILCLVLTAGLLSACAASAPQQSTGKVQVVATIFPVYDWVRTLVGERREQVEVTFLLDQGVDLHSYQPSVADMIKVSECDLFIYVGGESDRWVEDARKEAVNRRQIAVDLLETLGNRAREEEITEGMESEEDDENEAAYDEHVWLSLKNAALLCRRLADALCTVDEEGASVYRANAETYIKKLEELDAAYQAAVDGAARKTLLFGDRFPFRYLAEDYGLTYYAAFAGCAAETEASFETVVFLAGKVDELGLPCILKTESSDGALAETIRHNTDGGDQIILTMDSMQSVTARDVAAGATYLGTMENNLRVMQSALK